MLVAGERADLGTPLILIAPDGTAYDGAAQLGEGIEYAEDPVNSAAAFVLNAAPSGTWTVQNAGPGGVSAFSQDGSPVIESAAISNTVDVLLSEQ